MESGVDGIEVIMPHQAGAAITVRFGSLLSYSQEIYGKFPLPEPAVNCDQWIRGAVEKPHSRQLSTNSRGLTSLQNHAATTESHLLTPADIKSFLQNFRQKSTGFLIPAILSRHNRGEAVGV